MKPRTKKLLNFLLIFGTLGVVLFIGFKDADISEILNAFAQSAPQWIAVCLLCPFLTQ